MESNETKINAKKVRTWGFAAGGTLLLAVLTLVLCVMGGVFDFRSPDASPTPVPLPSVTYSVPADVPETDAPADTRSISAVCGEGGSITPYGLVDVELGGSLTFTMLPDEGYELTQLKVDGNAVALASTYTFTNVTENHSMYAVFSKIPEETESPSPSPSETPTPAPTVTPPPPSAPVSGSPTDIG